MRVGVLDGLVHGLAVDRLEAVEVQELRDRRSDAREGDGPLHAHARRHEPGAVPEHRHVLDVVPRAHVRQPGADEVGLERDVGELRAAIRAPAPPRAQEELVGDRACEAHQVLIARLRARGEARHGDGGGHEQAESEREQEEALRGHRATSVPDLAPNDNRGGSLDHVASGRRLTMLVAAMALVGAPAVALTAFCVGESCAQEDGVATAVPFCPLPADLRAGIEAGFRQGRSPDVMAATAGTEVVTIVDGTPVSWPSTSPHDARVPIVFFGAGVSDAPLPDGTGLDQIAPTLASILGFDRPHPQVRAGVAVDGVASGQRPRLVVVIAMKGVGTAAFEAKRATRRSMPRPDQRGRGHARGIDGFASAGSGGVADHDRHRRAADPARDHRVVRPQRQGRVDAGVGRRRSVVGGRRRWLRIWTDTSASVRRSGSSPATPPIVAWSEGRGTRSTTTTTSVWGPTRSRRSARCSIEGSAPTTRPT